MDAGEPLERAYREEATRIRAALAARTGDVGLAEDAVQDAFVEAMEHWPRDGVPPNPGGWLATTARRKALDRLRRDKAGAEKMALLAAADGAPDAAESAADQPGDATGVGIGGPGGADLRADDELLSLVFAVSRPRSAVESWAKQASCSSHPVNVTQSAMSSWSASRRSSGRTSPSPMKVK